MRHKCCTLEHCDWAQNEYNACWQALEVCYFAAKQQIERNAVRSLVALAAPDWSEDVVATAAALAAEMAAVACIRSLLLQVRFCH